MEKGNVGKRNAGGRKRTYEEEEASQIGETSQRADVASQRVAEWQGLQIIEDRAGQKKRDGRTRNQLKVD